MIAIIDYETGNVGSVLNMLRKLGVPAKLTADPREMAAADGLILPGVGAFDRGMQNLARKDLIKPLNDLVLGENKPVLGICLGLQLMGSASAEGSTPGLGWFNASVRKFERDPAQPRLRIPHMGWNLINVVRPDPLLENLPAQPRYYFVHSYYFPATAADALATTSYLVPFSSILGRNHIRGCQFHPEKSHSYGLALLRNFSLLINPAPDQPRTVTDLAAGR